MAYKNVGAYVNMTVMR